ncbi:MULTISPECIES: hypothetical protein [unclassified Pseudomonas]|uniref:hypothetical protein n=1 Tax=unclassified Pseudomonas TaxID=196821 RepID=UPI000BA49187|nr:MULTISPECIES: hypothetical protein [unclassified Pseudomonas]MCU1725157.1 hypothetical protein [Pseudomonas sp. 5P_5.1_Bac1]MCU1733470.1 hypothetical protein [Pseudomonas sp. 20P_3.2_Bac4]MCU1744326.1 hypothetical protein [Pseudomonas sp. 20P_3.2_Bac5]
MFSDEKGREEGSSDVEPTEGQEWLPAEEADEGEDAESTEPAGAEDRDDYIDVEPQQPEKERPDISRASNAERYSRQR